MGGKTEQRAVLEVRQPFDVASPKPQDLTLMPLSCWMLGMLAELNRCIEMTLGWRADQAGGLCSPQDFSKMRMVAA